MTYFGVLLAFIVPPLFILLVVVPRDLWRWLFRRQGEVDWPAYGAILTHVALALIYTTPWDNYLVATGVWWYDPGLVSGLRLGWVPVEEYIFFILQTLLTGLWTVGWVRWGFKSQVNVPHRRGLRIAATLAIFFVWLVSSVALVSGLPAGTYLTLILSWALIPLMIQLIFGADILWANWKLVCMAILPTTLYLWLVDLLAINSGTWAIDPRQTTGWMAGALPVEEMVFFLMTNTIIGFGMTLMLSPVSRQRTRAWMEHIRLPGRLHGGVRHLRSHLTVLVVWVAIWAWVGVLIATPFIVAASGGDVFPRMATLGTLLQLAAVLSALALAWPVSKVLRIALAVFASTWLVEAIGQAGGLPFGRYHYTGALQPQVAGVPVLIPLAWMMMLAAAWGVTGAILGRSQARLGRAYPFVFAALAGLVFTAWDLYLDPQMTARHLWVWDQPGEYFGIPWVNFLGWWITAALLTVFLRPANLPRLPLFLIYTLTWGFQAIGLGVFGEQPGPAFAGFLGMGIFVVWAWQREGVRWMSLSGKWWAFSAARSNSS
jgi:lycopene beta-cyclase